MRLGIRATWNGAADFSAAIRRAVFSGLSSIGVSLAEPSSVIRQVIKVQNMALLCTRLRVYGFETPAKKRPRLIIPCSRLPQTSNNIIQKGLAFVRERSG